MCVMDEEGFAEVRRKPTPVGLRINEIPVTKSKGNQAQRRAGRFDALTIDGTVWLKDGPTAEETEEINTAASNALSHAQSGSGLVSPSGSGLVPRDVIPPEYTPKAGTKKGSLNLPEEESDQIFG